MIKYIQSVAFSFVFLIGGFFLLSPINHAFSQGIATPYGGPVFNGPGLQGGADIVEANLDSKVSKGSDIKGLIIGWVNFFLEIVAIVAVLAIVWAGFMYITSIGDDSRIETAKKIILWAIVGLVLILASYAIVNTVISSDFSKDSEVNQVF